MDIKHVLFALSNASGTSGMENDIAEILKKELAGYGDVTVDPMGNVMCTAGNPDAKRHILIEAHIDEIGLVVTHIDEKGFLRVAKVGGVDRRVLLGHEVIVLGRERLFGVVTCMPPHLIKDEDKKFPDFDKLAIDIGMDQDKAKKLVSVGDRIVLRQFAAELQNGQVTGKAFDDRAGAAAVLYCLDLLKDKPLDVKVTALFSVQEEVGIRGAKVAAYTLDPDEAISVDVSFALTPEAAKEKCGEAGKGPMIGFSPVLSPEMTQKLIDIAERESIPYQKEIMGGVTSTDADSISISRTGVKTALLSIPLKYIHTAVETVSVSDIENTALLMEKYIVTG